MFTEVFNKCLHIAMKSVFFKTTKLFSLELKSYKVLSWSFNNWIYTELEAPTKMCIKATGA